MTRRSHRARVGRPDASRPPDPDFRAPTPWKAWVGIFSMLATAVLFMVLVGGSSGGPRPATRSSRTDALPASPIGDPRGDVGDGEPGDPNASGGVPRAATGAAAGTCDAVLGRQLERLLVAPDIEIDAFLARHGAVPPRSDTEVRELVESLRRLTRHAKSTVRRAAILCLGRIPAARESDDPTIAGLDDMDPGVRREAVIARTRHGLGECWRQLVPLLKDPDASVRLAVADGLAGVAQAEARAALRSLFLDPSDVVAAAAARALGRQPATAACPEIVAASRADDPRLRLAASRVLALAHTPECLDPLRALLEAPEEETRTEAVRGLASVGGHSAVPAREIVETVALATGRSRSERLAALEGLATSESPPTLDGLLTVATDDPDALLRLAACRTLFERGDRRCILLLAELRRIEPGPRCAVEDRDLVRCGAMEALQDAARAKVAPAVALVGDDIETRIQALGLRPEPGEVAELTSRFGSGDPANAQRLVNALIGRGGHASARGLSALAAHTDPAVRSAALRGIAQLRIRVKDAVPQARAARDDPDPAVRSAALAAIGAVGDATDVPSLLDALSSDDKDVAAAAYEGLRTMTEARLPYRASAWQQWWRETRPNVPATLAQGLERLESGGVPDAPATARRLVERNVWMDPAATQSRLDKWLRSSDPRLQEEAYRLVARCRLGEFADQVSWALRLRGDPAIAEAAGACAAGLGIRID